MSVNTGAISPGTTANDTSTGSVIWTSTDNIKVSDNVYSVGSLEVPVLLSSFSESLNDGGTPQDSNDYQYIAQSFTNSSLTKLDSCKFYLKKALGSPAGSAYAKIFAHTGVYGTSSKPTGSALATSDAFDVSTLTSSYALITFTFSGVNKIDLTASTYYCIALYYPSGNSTNYIRTGNYSLGGASGNLSYSTTGSSYTASGGDFNFYVYGVTSSSYYLKASNFGFSITPAGVITGIKAEVEGKSNGTDLVKENSIKIVKSTGIIGTTNKSTGASLSTSDAYVSYGGDGDLWGETWTPSDVMNSNFGVVYSATGSGTVSIDHVRMTIYYDPHISVSQVINISESVSVEIPSIDLKILGTSPATLDSYPVSPTSSMWFDSTKYYGQSFTAYYKTKIASVQFYLYKVGSPTGNVVVQIYAHTGTFGTSGLPTGSVLATSDAIDVSTLPTSSTLKTLTFSALNKIDLIQGVHYFAILYYPNGTLVSPSINFGRVNGGITSGNSASSADGITWANYVIPIPFNVVGDDGPISDSLEISTSIVERLLSQREAEIINSVNITESSTVTFSSDLIISQVENISVSESYTPFKSISYPSSVITVPSGSGFPWVNPSNAKTENSIYSLALFPSFTVTQTDYLVAQIFLLSIPTLSKIEGIKVEIKRRSTAGTVKDLSVNLVKANGTLGIENKATATLWTTTNEWVTYGGSTDLWGNDWTASDINSGGFGVALRAQCPLMDSEGWVDAFRITIYSSLGWVLGVDTFDSLSITESTTLNRINADDRYISVEDIVNLNENLDILSKMIFVSSIDSLTIEDLTSIYNIYSTDLSIFIFDSASLFEEVLTGGMSTGLSIFDSVEITDIPTLQTFKFTGGRSPTGQKGLSL